MTYISSTELREQIIAEMRSQGSSSPAFYFGVNPPPAAEPPRRSSRVAAAAAAAAAAPVVNVAPPPPPPLAPPRARPRAVAAAVSTGGGAGAGGAAASAEAVVVGGGGGGVTVSGGVARAPLAVPARSAFDGWAPGSPFSIDLSRLTDGQPFIIDAHDYRILNSFTSTSTQDINDAVALYRKIPEWTNVGGNNAEFRHGSTVVRRTAFLGAGTYGTAFDATYGSMNCVVKMIRLENADRETDIPSTNQKIFLGNLINTIKETIIHVALVDTCMSYPEIAAAQAAEKMARVPQIYGFFRTEGKGFDLNAKDGTLSTTEVDVKYMVIVMEKLDSTLDTFLERSEHNPLHLTTVGAVSMYQLASLLDVLGEVLEYNHRDMKLDNAMVKVSSGAKTLCGVPHFQTYIIDFGCSRMNYRGKQFLCNDDLFKHSSDFNPAHDITYAAWSYRHTIGCEVNLKKPCSKYNPVFDLVLQSILRASGINFDSALHEYKRGLTAAFYTGLSDAGVPARLQKMVKVDKRKGAFFVPQNIHIELITPHGVKLMAKHVIRMIGQLCHPNGRHNIAEEEANVRALVSLHGLDEDDDESVVSEVSDP